MTDLRIAKRAFWLSIKSTNALSADTIDGGISGLPATQTLD